MVWYAIGYLLSCERALRRYYPVQPVDLIDDDHIDWPASISAISLFRAGRAMRRKDRNERARHILKLIFLLAPSFLPTTELAALARIFQRSSQDHAKGPFSSRSPQPMNLESQNAMSAVDGATIERRIRISQPDEGRGKCKGSRAIGVSRSGRQDQRVISGHAAVFEQDFAVPAIDARDDGEQCRYFLAFAQEMTDRPSNLRGR
jgi:hypothetical protein